MGQPLYLPKGALIERKLIKKCKSLPYPNLILSESILDGIDIQQKIGE